LERRCPFALASPIAAPVAPQAVFAAHWYVSGIARLGDADFVTIKARDLATEFSLYGQEPDPENHVTLVRIDWSDEVGKSIVTIRKDAETAKLEFNEAEIRGPRQGSPPADQLGKTGVPPSSVNSPTGPGSSTSRRLLPRPMKQANEKRK
jgi:hypothetical protein